MNIKNNTRQGLSMVEVLLGILIISVVFAIALNLTGSGLRGADKGMSHLVLMQSAAILMAQIEYDLLRASNILDPALGVTDTAARWELLTDDADGMGTVIYNQVSNGVERHFTTASDNDRYIYCKGLNVDLDFRHVGFPDTTNSSVKRGMLIKIKVLSAEKFGTTEEFKMKRLFICKNIINSL